MGIFDRNVSDGLDAMFDFNRDGKLDPFEEDMMYQFLSNDGLEPEVEGDYDMDMDDDLWLDEEI